MMIMMMMRIILFIILLTYIYLVCVIRDVNAVVQCLAPDPANPDVLVEADWFFISMRKGDVGYWISSSVQQKPMWRAQSINHCNGAFKRTLVQAEQATVSIVTWNSYKGRDLYAHANGALIWDDIDDAAALPVPRAVLLTNSCPRSGRKSSEYGFHGCFTKSQHVHCMNFASKPAVPLLPMWKSWLTNTWYTPVFAAPFITAPAPAPPLIDPKLSQLEQVALHLMYRRVKILVDDVNRCSQRSRNDNNRPLTQLMCTQPSAAAAIRHPNRDDAAWIASYALQSRITMIHGGLAGVFSKKQSPEAADNFNGDASVWDDIIPDHGDHWQVQTWKHGTSVQLPAACCDNTVYPVSFTHDTTYPSRAGCRPADVQWAMYKLTQLLPAFAGGAYAWSNTAPGRTALSRIVLHMIGTKAACATCPFPFVPTVPVPNLQMWQPLVTVLYAPPLPPMNDAAIQQSLGRISAILRSNLLADDYVAVVVNDLVNVVTRAPHGCVNSATVAARLQLNVIVRMVRLNAPTPGGRAITRPIGNAIVVPELPLWQQIGDEICYPFALTQVVIDAVLAELGTNNPGRLTSHRWSMRAVAQWNLRALLPPVPPPVVVPPLPPVPGLPAITDLPVAGEPVNGFNALTCDHSKFAWSSDGWICAGDNNRQGGVKKGFTGGNLKRGGGAQCWPSPTLQLSLDAMAESYVCANPLVPIGGLLYRSAGAATGSGGVIQSTNNSFTDINRNNNKEGEEGEEEEEEDGEDPSDISTPLSSVNNIVSSRTRGQISATQVDMCDIRCRDPANSEYCCSACNGNPPGPIEIF